MNSYLPMRPPVAVTLTDDLVAVVAPSSEPSVSLTIRELLCFALSVWSRAEASSSLTATIDSLQQDIKHLQQQQRQQQQQQRSADRNPAPLLSLLLMQVFDVLLQAIDGCCE